MTPILLGLSLAWGGLAEGQEGEWNLEKVRKKAKTVLEVEHEGQPWNRISWWTDPALAEAHARKTGKPIFVFLYVDEGGPAPEPC